MKKNIVKSLLLLLMVLMASTLAAQSSVKGMNARGVTGIIVTPTARIGWEKSDIALDGTYSFLHKDDPSHIPAVTLSLFKKAEIALAYDIEDNGVNTDLQNLLIGGKFQLYKEGGTALAIGGNFETVMGDDVIEDDKKSSDIYIVTTYGGDFFDLPAVTSMMFGWQVMEADDIKSNLNYSMGFELGLFPEKLKNYVYWISDFSNYSYAAYQYRIDRDRGVFNTGLRLDPIKDSNFKLVFTLVGTDLMDEDCRGLMANATFGMAF